MLTAESPPELVKVRENALGQNKIQESKANPKAASGDNIEKTQNYKEQMQQYRNVQNSLAIAEAVKVDAEDNISMQKR